MQLKSPGEQDGCLCSTSWSGLIERDLSWRRHLGKYAFQQSLVLCSVLRSPWCPVIDNLRTKDKINLVHEVKWSESHSVMPETLSMNSPGQNTGVGSLSLLQGIFLTQVSNPGLPHCRRILYQLSHKGSPRILERVQFSSVQSLSCVRLFATPWIAACQASLSITNSRSLLKLMSIELMMPSSHLILCRPLLLLPPIPPNIRVFSNESTLHMRWPKYWSFSFSISPSNKQPGLISFRMDCLDLLAVQGTLKSLLQYHSSKASIFQHSAFFTVQLSQPYMTTGKTIALTRWIFVVCFLICCLGWS